MLYINLLTFTYLHCMTGSGSGIMPFSSPGGSTVQWDAGRGLLCLALQAADAVDVCKF